MSVWLVLRAIVVKSFCVIVMSCPASEQSISILDEESCYARDGAYRTNNPKVFVGFHSMVMI